MSKYAFFAILLFFTYGCEKNNTNNTEKQGEDLIIDKKIEKPKRNKLVNGEYNVFAYKKNKKEEVTGQMPVFTVMNDTIMLIKQNTIIEKFKDSFYYFSMDADSIYLRGEKGNLNIKYDYLINNSFDFHINSDHFKTITLKFIDK